MSAVRLPGILWAQRKDKLFLTIDLQDSDKPAIRLENDGEEGSGKVVFKGKAKSHATGAEYHEYELQLVLLHAVDTKESKISVNARNVVLVIAKKAGEEEYWPRLLKDKAQEKASNVKVDWDKWVDEDEDDEGGDSPGFDLSNLQDFSNFDTSTGPLAGAGDESDSDNEELPDLEKA